MPPIAETTEVGEQRLWLWVVVEIQQVELLCLLPGRRLVGAEQTLAAERELATKTGSGSTRVERPWLARMSSRMVWWVLIGVLSLFVVSVSFL